MSKYLSSVSRIALAAAALSSFASLAQAVDTTIHTGETVTTSQGIDLDSTLFVEEGGAIIVPDERAVGIGGGSGTVTLDNSGTISSTAGHTIEASGSGTSAENPLKLIINNRETGVISNDDDDNRDVIRPTRNNFLVEINNWGTIIHQGNLASQGDGIDFQDKDAVSQTVNNFETGLIEGARHGITGDKPATINNSGHDRRPQRLGHQFRRRWRRRHKPRSDLRRLQGLRRRRRRRCRRRS